MELYNVVKRDFSSDFIISAPVGFLKTLSRESNRDFTNAKWMYPRFYLRCHILRLFNVEKEIDKMELSFICDNKFDLWLNGKAICEEVRESSLIDVTDYATVGENNLHIRIYQSDSPDYYTSAMAGGIRILYTDGSVEEVLSGNEFEILSTVGFWENEEPKDFETMKDENRRFFNCSEFETHPKALRRSFWFRKNFAVEKKLCSATLCITALGCYEPYINGKRVCDAFFMPSASEKYKEYQCFDILELLQRGENVISVITGNGWYNCASWGEIWANVPAIIADIELEYEDGTKECIITDKSWKCIPSQLVENDLQFGERYDASLVRDDYFAPEFDENSWIDVHAELNEEYKELVLHDYPFIKIIRRHSVSFVGYLKNGAALFDAGMELSGRATVKFKNLEKGQRVCIRYCERLKDNGEPETCLYGAVMYPEDSEPDGKAPYLMRNLDVYYANGDDYEIYEPRFTYTGYRYIYIEGLTSISQIESITANEIHNDLEETGFIKTPCKEIMDIFNAAKSTWLNNIYNGPTDCPTREKNFWNGDTQIFSRTACFITDTSKFFAAWTDRGRKQGGTAYGWGDEEYVIPLNLYRFYGDKGILRTKFPKMLELIEARTESKDMILPENPLSPYCDWLAPTGLTLSREFFSACWHYKMLCDVSYVASVLGENGISEELAQKAAKVKTHFNEKYLIDGGCDYSEKCQGGIVLPVAFGLAPKEHCESLVKTLVNYIKEADYHITTGFLSTRFMPYVLCDYGYSDVAMKLVMQKTIPSWLYMLSTGATNITENWEGMKATDRSMSMSHFSYGSIAGWFFECLGGLRIDECSPSLNHIVLKPVMIEEIGSFTMTYKSIYGTIKTHWEFKDGKPEFTYELPDGVTAEFRRMER